MYLLDQEANEIRRIAQIEWKTRQRGVIDEAQHTCLTILVKRLDDEDREITDDNDETYMINDFLFDMIKAAPLPYNERLLLLSAEDANI